jgi:hypothetical protein
MDLKVFMADKNYEKQRPIFLGLKWLLKATSKDSVFNPIQSCLHVLKGSRIAATNGHIALIMNGVGELDVEPGAYKPFFYRGVISLIEMGEISSPNFDDVIFPPSEDHRISEEQLFNRDGFHHLVITKTGMPFNMDYLNAAYRPSEECGIFFTPMGEKLDTGQLLVQYRNMKTRDIQFIAVVMSQKK